MNISYKWINELVESGLSAEEMAERLTSAGCAVEEMHDLPGGDKQLVAEITSNRPDWLCHFGVAREVAALTSKTVKIPKSKITESEADINSLASVKVHNNEFCPRYTARVIKNVKVGPSPDWLKQKLEAVGLRPINNIVDITNYILYEMNQPLHAFDYDLLEGNQINVRTASTGETLMALDGTECKLDPSMLVIADAKKPVAIAGVMGGASSEVSDKTINILLESAYFESTQVRRTSRKLKLLSDSSYRFERGIDMQAVAAASERACALILEVAGGELAKGIIDTAPDLGCNSDVTMRYSRCNKILGFEVGKDEIKAVFSGLGLKEVKDEGDEITVNVPSFRRDLTREIDLIEEIARVVGYDRVPETITMRVARAHESDAVYSSRKIRNALTNLGYHECITDPFVLEKWQDNENAVRIENPVDSGRPVLRKTLVPSLLEVRRVNRHEKDVALFELNSVYCENPRLETAMLCILDDRGMDYVRGALEGILKSLRVINANTLRIEPADFNNDLAVGAQARIILGEKTIGYLGTINDKQAKIHDLEKAVSVLEVEFAAIASQQRTDRIYKPLPKFPGIRRDIALVVNEEIKWADICACLSSTQSITPHLESVYRGKGLEAGEKSIAFSFTYINSERSMTDEEANAMRDELIAKLTATFAGSHLR